MKKSYISALFIIIVLLLASLFYWYEYRPTNIRKACYKVSRKLNLVAFGEEIADKEYDQKYNDCLKSYGL